MGQAVDFIWVKEQRFLGPLSINGGGGRIEYVPVIQSAQKVSLVNNYQLRAISFRTSS